MKKTASLRETAHDTRTQSAGRAIQILSRRLNAAIKGKLAEKDLSLDHFILLMTLTESENLTQTELGQRSFQQNHTITRGLDALDAMGLVERRADANSRRSYRIFLTKKGRAFMPELFAIVQDVNVDLLRNLDSKERVTLVALLSKITS